MPKLKPIKPERLVKLAKKLGFVEVRQKGSHLALAHTDGRILTVSMHTGKDISVGLLVEIIKEQLKISREEFEQLL